MHKMFLPFLALVGLCFARPSPDGSLLSTEADLFTGFPTEYSPLWNLSGGYRGSLFVPLNPRDYPHVEQKFARGPSPAGDFRGGQLISSIISQLDPIWKSTTDVAFTPIVHKIYQRNGPFRNVLHTIRPSSSTVRPEAVLTPLKVGIAYLWIMKLAVQNWPAWPGHIVGSIYNEDAGALGTLVGWINVQNLPETRLENTPAVSGHNVSTAMMDQKGDIRISMNRSESNSHEFSEIPKVLRERSWLQCFILLIIDCMRFSPSASVRGNLLPGTQSMTLHYRSIIDPKMEANLTFVRDENWSLKFHHLVEVLRNMVDYATERDIWDNKELAFARETSQGPVLAFISFGRTWRDRPNQITLGNGIAHSES